MSSAPKIQGPLWRIPEWFNTLSPEVLATLAEFNKELLQANKTLSLIPPKSVQTADQVHFAECIMASQIIMESNPALKSIWTFGSGNGFPGMVLAILYPKVLVEFHEPDARKFEFLKETSTRLKSSNVNIHKVPLDKLPAGSITNSLCRGFADITKTMMAFRNHVPKGGNAYAIKSDVWGIELSRVPTQLCSLWEPILVKDFQVPMMPKKSSVVNLKRI